MRKFPDYDSDLITMWFDRMGQIVPGLVKPLATRFAGLTLPDLMPVIHLYDTLVRYGNLDCLKTFREGELIGMPDWLLVSLAEITIENGEMLNFDRGRISAAYHSFSTLTAGLDEEDRLKGPYCAAETRFITISAHLAINHPDGKRFLSEAQEPEAVKRARRPSALRQANTPALRLIASNGNLVPDRE